LALGAALVDRARVYSRRQIAAVRVEGATPMHEYVGPWMKARLQLPQAPESVDQAPRGRRRPVREPTLMVGIRDLEGGSVSITTEHRIGVLSKHQFGDGVESVFEVTGDPEPIRKKRRVIGWMLTVRQVPDHPREPLAGAGDGPASEPPIAGVVTQVPADATTPMQRDLTLYQGDSWTMGLEFATPDGPLDVSAWSWLAQVRSGYADDAPVAVAMTVNVVGSAVELSLSAAQTAVLADGRWDVQSNDGSRTVTWMFGALTVLPEVSR
jgi:hypothetical protein